MSPIKTLKAVVNKVLVQRELPEQVDKASSVAWQESDQYDDYIENQIRRTLAKKNHQGTHTFYFLRQVNELSSLVEQAILSVGCRNTTELDFMKELGATDVTAVDLYSHHPSITVMDMHELKFDADSFDVVFSSHSLEHAYDPDQVTSEFKRVCRHNGIVAIEVPVHFEPTVSDLVDFQSVDFLIENYFPGCPLIWSEERSANSENNPHAVDIIRVVLRVLKN